MTIPYERYRAVLNAEDFLLSLLDPKKTPHVPKDIRRQAGWCLKHYPTRYDMEQVCKTSPDVFKNEFWLKENNNE